MKKLIALACLFLVTVAHAADRPEIARYVKAYSGEEGVNVYVLRVGPAEKGEVLIQVTGIDSPLDGIIFKGRVEVRDQGSSRRYYVTRNGQESAIMNLDRDSGALYLPSLPNNLREPHVKYNADLTKQTIAEHMLTQWLEQPAKK